MTELLRRAIAAVEKLPDEQQNQIATRLLAELENEQMREKRFDETTDEQWDQLATRVRQEIATGEMIYLEENLTFVATSY
jgi:hypothetical protein